MTYIYFLIKMIAWPLGPEPVLGLSSNTEFLSPDCACGNTEDIRDFKKPISPWNSGNKVDPKEHLPIYLVIASITK